MSRTNADKRSRNANAEKHAAEKAEGRKAAKKIESSQRLTLMYNRCKRNMDLAREMVASFGLQVPHHYSSWHCVESRTLMECHGSPITGVNGTTPLHCFLSGYGSKLPLPLMLTYVHAPHFVDVAALTTGTMQLGRTMIAVLSLHPQSATFHLHS